MRTIREMKRVEMTAAVALLVSYATPLLGLQRLLGAQLCAINLKHGRMRASLSIIDSHSSDSFLCYVPGVSGDTDGRAIGSSCGFKVFLPAHVNANSVVLRLCYIYGVGWRGPTSRSKLGLV